jgi:antitoxin VapB
VRVPKQIRVESRELRLTRPGSGIILEPVTDSWSWLDAIAGTLDEDFVKAVREQPQAIERPGLEKLFGS